MKTKVIILGTGGNCIDIADTLNDINKSKNENRYECIGFLDDDAGRQGLDFFGVKVIGMLADAGKFDDALFVNGIGSARNFWKKQEIIRKTGVSRDRFLTVIHPTASVSDWSRIGRGCVIFQNVAITANSRIGDHVVILPNSIISHDASIGDFTTIAGGVSVSGNVEVGDSCYLGTNAAIKDGMKIGSRSLIGMGSVVLEDVEENSIVVGNPARFLRNTVG